MVRQMAATLAQQPSMPYLINKRHYYNYAGTANLQHTLVCNEANATWEAEVMINRHVRSAAFEGAY